MKRKNKILFLAITLATVLILTSVVNATNTTDHNTDHTLSKKTSTPANSEIKETTINKEKITSKNNMEEKTINKTDKTEKQTKSDTVTIDGNEYTNVIQNQNLGADNYYMYFENTFINNCTLNNLRGSYNMLPFAKIYINNSIVNDSFISAYGDLFCIANSTLNNSDIEAFCDLKIYGNTTSYGNSTIKYTKDFECENIDLIKSALPKTPLEGNIEFNNEIITENLELSSKCNTTFINCLIQAEISNKGNITFTDCNISAKITNQGNITLINCSLSNNNMTATGSKTDGFLLENKGNVTMIDCRVENNTFNTTLGDNIELYGAIVNSGILNIVNTTFYNNSLGYMLKIQTPGAYTPGSYVAGTGCCIVNKENAFVDIQNSEFSGNYAGRNGIIFSQGSLNITSSEFNNNTATTYSPTICTEIPDGKIANINIVKCNFSNNVIIRAPTGSDLGNQIEPTLYLNSKALYDNVYNCKANIDECNFQKDYEQTSNALLISVYTKDMIATISNSNIYGGITVTYDGRNRFNTTLNNITNNNFTNDKRNKINIKTIDANIYNNTFNNTYIDLTRNFNLDHNTITNNSLININMPLTLEEYLHTTIMIHDNIFENNTQSLTLDDGTLLNSFIKFQGTDNTFQENYIIENNTYQNNIINDTIDVELPLRIYKGEPITITATYTLNNPENFDHDILEQNQFQIIINGEVTQTLTTPEFTFTPTKNTQIIIQPTISTNNKILQIKPITLADNITITPENINTYTYKEELIGVDPNSRIYFKGNFTNTDLTITTSNLEIDGKDATFTNSTFTIEEENIILQNIHINNTETEYPISNTGDNNIIQNNTITLKNTQGKTTAIYNKASNTIIQNNILHVDGPALNIDHNTGYGTANTQAILLIGGDKNKVTNNKITVTTTTTSETFGTIEGITNHNEATRTQITKNNITINGSRFNYAINSLNNVANINISENNIQSTGTRYTCGIQVGNGATSITINSNNITATCHNTTTQDEEAITFGIVATNMGDYRTTEDIDIRYNNINLTGTVNYGIEIYQTHNARSQYNNITAYGTYSMGIGYAHSPGGYIEYNRIRLTGDSRQPIGQVTEDLPPENVGILIEIESEQKTIGYNHITVYDKGEQDLSIKLKSNDISLYSDNWATTSTKTMEDTLYLAPGITVSLGGSYPPWVAFERPDKNYTRLDFTIPETSIVNKTINIKINLTDDNTGNPILNNNQEPLYLNLQINNETTTILFNNETSTYTYTPTTPGEYNITLTLPENYLYYSSTTITKTLTVNPKPETQANITDTNITVGDSTTLTATFYDDDDQPVPDGIAIFRVNGKTLRDDQGNVIYVDVTNGRAELPDVNITQEWTKEGTTIQAVYIGDDNNEPITTKPTTITVTKPEATITLEAPTPATAGQEITLKATVTDGENNITNGRVAFKLNGKTLKDPKTGKALYANVENGVATITYTIPEKTKAKTYNLTAVFTDIAYDRKEASAELVVAKA